MQKLNLPHPPITEVVCGFIFRPLALDVMDFGIYWKQRREDFPSKELHPPLQEGFGIKLIGVPSLRTWLVSEPQDLVIQLQEDRFYMNWRRREGNYPRFSDHDDHPGLLAQALNEFDKFKSFCKEQAEQAPSLERLELTKIDVLEQNTHYSDAEDLGRLLKVARVFEDVQAGSTSQLQLRLLEEHEGGATHVSVVVGERDTKIETRMMFAPTEDLKDAFVRANDQVNSVFFGLLNDEEFNRFEQPAKREQK